MQFAAARSDGVLAGADFDEIAVFGEADESSFEGLAFLALSSQEAHEVFEIRPRVRGTGDLFKDFAVGHGMRIAPRLRSTVPCVSTGGLGGAESIATV